MTKNIEENMDQLITDFKAFKDRQDIRLDALEKRKAPRDNNHPGTSLMQKADNSFTQYLVSGNMGYQQKSLSTDPERGGVVIPHVLHDKIAEKIQDLSPIRRLARHLKISTSSVDILVNKKSPEAGWVTEEDARGETDAPEMAKITIPVHEVYAKPRATQKLLDDAAINVEDWLVTKIGEKMAALETQAFLNGDGNGKPKGILAYDRTTDANPEWGKFQELTTGANGSFDESAGADVLIDTLHSLPSHHLSGAVWLMSRSALSAVRKLKDESTGAYLWQPALGDRSATLLGHPIVVSDDMPALTPGTESTSIIFGNFYAAYQVVDRQQIHVLRDPYSAKPYVEFYVTKRLGGDVIDFEALKVINFKEKEKEEDETEE